MKSDVFLLTSVFEKFKKVSMNEFDINSRYCVILPGYRWHCEMNYTGTNSRTLLDKDLILLKEKNIRGGLSSVMSDRYAKTR